MKLSQAFSRMNCFRGLVVALATAVAGIWVLIQVAPELPSALVSKLVATPSSAVSPGATPQSDEPREPTEAERVSQEWSAAYRERDWPRAIELGLDLYELAPDSDRHAYNLACAYSLHAEPDKAARWLARAADNGFSLIKLLETDPDLESMRSHIGYQAALAVVKENRAAELAGIRAKFEQKRLHVMVPRNYQADQAVPLIIALHGKGGRAVGMAEQWRTVASRMGAILVTPQAVTPYRGGFSWCHTDSLDNLCDNAEFLVRLAFESVVREYKIDRERAVLTGFSEGGFVSQSIGPRLPYLFTGVIPMGSGYLREYDAPPKATGDRPPRFYFMSGERDRIVDEVPLAAQDYTAAGFPAEVRIYPKVGHSFPIDRDAELRNALDFVLQRKR